MPAATEPDRDRFAGLLQRISRTRLVTPIVELARSIRHKRRPRIPVGWVRFGSLRRLDPISANWGFDRGGPVDRWYIERFLSAHSRDFRGRTLEIGADRYASRFGGDPLNSLDILDVDSANPDATIIADLSKPETLPDSAYDCVIITQTLHLILDVPSAVRGIVRMLAPGGVALITVPGITPIEPPACGATWRWSLTALSLTELLSICPEVSQASVEAHGNVLTATAFLFGIAATELTRRELDHDDPAYPVIVTARVVRSAMRESP